MLKTLYEKAKKIYDNIEIGKYIIIAVTISLSGFFLYQGLQDYFPTSSTVVSTPSHYPVTSITIIGANNSFDISPVLITFTKNGRSETLKTKMKGYKAENLASPINCVVESGNTLTPATCR